MVDNASTDDSVEFTRRHFPEVKIIRSEKNEMFAGGNNRGIKNASGEIICLINNDVVVDPDFLQPLVAAFRENPRLAVAQSKVLDMNRPDYFEYAGASGGFIDRYGYPFMRGRIFFTLEPDRGQYDEPIEVFWASGACFFIRKSVLDQVGLLDEDFVLHMEEIDLCWRMHLSGWQVWCIPQSRVWHKGGGTLSAEDPRKVYWNYRNNIFLLVKNLSFVNLVKVLFARMFLDVAAFWGEIFRGRGRSAWSIVRAYWWILNHLALLRRKRRSNQQQRQVPDREIYRLVYPGSIVWEYFVRGRKKFSQLKRIRFILNDERKSQLIKKESESEWTVKN